MPDIDPNKSNADPRDKIRQIATGFILSRALTLAAELKIADTLKDAPKSAHEIATELSLHIDSLYRLLRFLSSHKIFEENNNHQFCLTPISQLMISDAPDSMHAYLDMLADNPPWDSIRNMYHTIKTGEPAFEHLHNVKFFEYMLQHPESNCRFNAGMSSFTSPDDSSIVNAFNFDKYKCVVDVGGGKGSFLATILSSYKDISGVLYDQPEIVNEPVEAISNYSSKRCEIKKGDFFKNVPQGGDLYTLKLILHDWDDELAVKILKNCHAALPADGKLLVIEGVMSKGNEPDPHKQLDMSMMLIFGGRERTEKEFDGLFLQAGLRLSRIIPTPSRLSIIEAVKI